MADATSTDPKAELDALKKAERHSTYAETRYWCDQYKSFATKAVAEVTALHAERDRLAQRVKDLEAKKDLEVRLAFAAGFLATVDQQTGAWLFDGPSAADRESQAFLAWTGRPR
jgi:hypothetical protein